MKRPNILIVMTDHQRWDTVEPDDPCQMPVANRLAEEGIKFTNTFCPTAHCCPARATFMSGLYPSRTGVWNNVCNAYAINRGPFESVKMWSQDLKDSGYDLAYSGKWHVSARDHQQPKDYGWRELMPYLGNIQDESAKWEIIRSEADKEDEQGIHMINMPGYHSHGLYGVKDPSTPSDEKTLKLALDELPKLAKGDKPWALFVGWNAPHAPYMIEQKYLDRYDPADIKLPESFYDDMNDKPDYYGKLRKRVFDQLGEEGTKEAMRHFWAMCSKIDDNLGLLLDKLDETGQTEDTLVIFCSDHGDYNGDHGLFHKQVPAFLGAYKVPMILRWPKGIKNPGRSLNEFVSLADFAPTFLDLTGVKKDRYFTGESLVPFLNDEKPREWREEICTQCEGTEQMFTQRMVVTHEAKFVYNGFGRDELYDLKKDPHEIKNLEADPAYESVKKDLVERMWRFAYKEQDRLGAVQYLMVNTAPWGPKSAFWSEKGKAMATAEPNPEISR
jgi:arylsulfatase A-like enzyme